MKFKSLLCILIFAALVSPSFAKSNGFQLIRSVTAVDSPAMSASTFDAKPAAAVAADGSKYMTIICAGTGTASSGQVVTKIWGGYGTAGPALPIATITWTLGTSQVLLDPQTHSATTLQYYAETASITNRWPMPVIAYASGSGGICTVVFDVFEVDWIYIEVTTLTNVSKANFYSPLLFDSIQR